MLSLFPRNVLDEILDLIESVSVFFSYLHLLLGIMHARFGWLVVLGLTAH